MTRKMYDSTKAADIPRDAEMVAGYVDGLYAWSAEDWALFPNRPHVTITVNGSGADVADVENGDLTPEQGGVWAAHQVRNGERPTLYCNRGNEQACIDACTAHGLARDQYDLFVSTLDGVAVMQPGAVATQYAGEAQSGGHYDISLVNDTWLVSAPPSLPPTGDQMIDFAIAPDGTRLDFVGIGTNGEVFHAVSHTGDLANLDASFPGPYGPYYEALGGYALSVRCEWRGGDFVVVVVGSDHKLYQKVATNSIWSVWTPIGEGGAFGV